jgi:hypothetical protein
MSPSAACDASACDRALTSTCLSQQCTWTRSCGVPMHGSLTQGGLRTCGASARVPPFWCQRVHPALAGLRDGRAQGRRRLCCPGSSSACRLAYMHLPALRLIMETKHTWGSYSRTWSPGPDAAGHSVGGLDAWTSLVSSTLTELEISAQSLIIWVMDGSRPLISNSNSQIST